MRRTSASCRPSFAQEVMIWIRLKPVCSAGRAKKVTYAKLSPARQSAKVRGSTDGPVINTPRSTIAEEPFLTSELMWHTHVWAWLYGFEYMRQSREKYKRSIIMLLLFQCTVNLLWALYVLLLVNNAINIMCQKRKMRTQRLFKWRNDNTA